MLTRRFYWGITRHQSGDGGVLGWVHGQPLIQKPWRRGFFRTEGFFVADTGNITISEILSNSYTRGGNDLQFSIEPFSDHLYAVF